MAGSFSGSWSPVSASIFCSRNDFRSGAEFFGSDGFLTAARPRLDALDDGLDYKQELCPCPFQ
jgi:hypothetical protein